MIAITKRPSPRGSTPCTRGSSPRWPTTIPACSGIVASLGPLAGRRVLDLGCGKGRFARSWPTRGAAWSAWTSPRRCSRRRGDGLRRVRGSARRLPFRSASFDAVIAVEVFEHLEPRAVDDACDEVRRVLRPGGMFVHGRQERVRDERPAAVAARVAVKWIDERRGLWMYPPAARSASAGSGPAG